MSRLYFVADGSEMARRRARAPAGAVVEAWADLVVGGGTFWVGEESKRLLDAAGERPMPAELTLPAERVAVYYGPRLTDLDSLPAEESVRARVVSAHGIAAAWITLDRFGARAAHEPTGPTDPVFHLRRPGGGAGHLWRLFQGRREAVDFMVQAWGEDSEGADWARALPIEDFATLIDTSAERPGR
jgi:hypothetical protein